MYKYVWIVMIAVPDIIFVIYSAYSVYVAISDAINNATYKDTIFDIIEDSFSNFTFDHDYLPIIWSVIFIVLLLCLFAISLSAFLFG